MKKPSMKYVILDAHALIHRAYHALPPLSNKKGDPTNAIYGFFSSFLKMLSDLKPDYLVAAFDRPEPTFRHREFKDYKAHRPQTPDDLISQIIRIKEMLNHIGVLVLEEPGYEADDIIGTLVSKLVKREDNAREVIIVTGDLDTLQLVQEGVKVYTMKRGISDTVIYDTQAVQERYRLDPEQLVDYKGLVGDPSDNIPGVTGIGPKSATTLLLQYGSIKNIYDHIDELSDGALKSKLVTYKQQALFSRELAQIHTTVPIHIDVEKARWKEIPFEKLEPLFVQLGFQSLLRRYQSPFAHQSSLFAPAQQGVDTVLPPSLKDKKLLAIASWLLQAESRTLEPPKTVDEAKEALKNEGLLEVFLRIEAPLVSILEEMEKKGILIDRKGLALLEKDLEKEVRTLRLELFAIAGEEFNPNSSDQLRDILFNKLKIPITGLKKTPRGKISTRENELLKIVDRHEIITVMMRYRELDKLRTTYVRPFFQKIENDGRIHTTFLQTGTSTGRLASQNPNLQNIPVQGDYAKRVKNIFLAPQGFTLASFDYSQIELRIAAHLSGDKKLKEAFAKGQDIHTLTASRVFKVEEKDVTPSMRRTAKVCNFGILYGLSAHGLAEGLHISRAEAADFIRGYFSEFPGIQAYIEDTKVQVRSRGYVQTFSGRKRWFPALQSIEGLSRAAHEALLREAVNMPIQGGSADVVKLAMIAVHRDIISKAKKESIFLILQIHDDLLFEIKTPLLPDLVRKIKVVMEKVVALEVPLVVDVKTGRRWGELSPFT